MVCEKTDHRTYKCPILINETVENRIKLIAKKSICKKCLNHPKAEKFNSLKSCIHCGMANHNTVLHMTKNEEQLTSKLTKIDGTLAGLLPTIQINIKTGEKWHKVRALIDQCSDITLMSESLARKLELPTKQTNTRYNGSSGVAKATKKTKITIGPWFGNEPTFTIEAFLTKNIATNLPVLKIKRTEEAVVLADPDYNQPGPVEMLLGTQVYQSILTDTKIRKEGSTILQETPMGWIISGQIEQEDKKRKLKNSFISCRSDEDSLNECMKKFWTLENAEEEENSNNMDLVEEIFTKTTERDDSGRFIVDIPTRLPARKL